MWGGLYARHGGDKPRPTVGRVKLHHYPSALLKKILPPHLLQRFMKKHLLLVSLLLTLTLPAVLRAADAAAAPTAPAASPYAILESFVGGTWIAALPPQKDQPPLRLELRFAWNENKQGVRFDSAWLAGEKRAPYTSGMYAWNAAKKSLIMFYTDSGGSLTEGTVAPEGNVLAHELTLANKDGSVDNVRVRLTKLGTDAFTNEIFVEKNGEWKKIVEVRYERHG
jgi:hypothetical protein